MTTYRIWGKLPGRKRELIDTATNPKEARYLKSEYQMAFGNNWELTVVPSPYKKYEMTPEIKAIKDRAFNQLDMVKNFHIQGTKTFRSN